MGRRVRFLAKARVKRAFLSKLELPVAGVPARANMLLK
jgi:hypothetical protein